MGNKAKPVKSKSSHCIDDLKHQQKRLHEILDFLDRVEDEGRQIPATLTDKQFQSLGIQLFDLDLKTGQTPPSVTQYFLPVTDDASRVLNSVSDPIDDRFTEYNRSRTKRIRGDSGWSNYLATAFVGHAYNQERSVFVSPWKQLILDDSKRGRLYHVGHSLDVKSGNEYGGGRHPHRVVLAVIDRKLDEYRPSVAELIVLVSWMLAAMRHQDATKVKRQRKDKAMRLHMIFPTLVYCFMQPAKARVLYGYFEDNALKVVATKAHNFDVPNYSEIMDSLTRWASPSIHANTEMNESLAVIEEYGEDIS